MGVYQSPPARSCIHEELLLALKGHTGDVFRRHGRPLGSGSPHHLYEVASDLEFIALTDRVVLARLLELGSHCCALDAFASQEELSWRRGGGSQYRSALANGIRELLDVYADALAKAEERMQSAHRPSLATLDYYLAEFKIVLPGVCAIVREVSSRGLVGSDILHLLHHKACCGVVELRSCLERLQWHCHQELLKQLEAWMVHGLLEDRGGEFFIQCSPASAATGGASVTPGTSSSPARPDDIANDWHRGFEVRLDLLPPEIANETPLSILFVGKAVRALRAAGAGLDGDALGAAAALGRLRAAPRFDPSALEVVVEGICGQAAKRLWDLLVGQGELRLHLAALRGYFLLGRGDFWQTFLLESRGMLRRPVPSATAEANISIPFQQSAAKSSAASDALFSYVHIRYPTETGAQAYAPASTRIAPPGTMWGRSLQLAAPYSAGERGTSSSLVTPAQPTAPPVVQAAAGPSTLPARPPSPRFTPQTGEAQAQGKAKRSLKVPDYDPNWDPLTLEYRVKWPLNLLLSQEALLRYSRMFQYLFRLKSLQLELEGTWAALGGDRHSSAAHSSRPQDAPPLWQIRSHMAHFVDNLVLYIQVDVVEVQSRKMLEAMAGVADLRAGVRAHEAFVAACVVQSCLDVPTFGALLSRVLVVCRRFCEHLRDSEEAGISSPTYPTDLVEEFQRGSRLLFRLLSTPAMQSRARAPFLRQLLLRLDYNGFVRGDAERHAAAVAPGEPVPQGGVLAGATGATALPS